MSQLFVVEHYDDSGVPGSRPEPFPPPPADVRVFYTVVVPADDVVMALVQSTATGSAEGTDGESVRSALAAAGWHVDRITPAIWAPLQKDAT